jgi:hypothetical protein
MTHFAGASRVDPIEADLTECQPVGVGKDHVIFRNIVFSFLLSFTALGCTAAEEIGDDDGDDSERYTSKNNRSRAPGTPRVQASRRSVTAPGGASGRSCPVRTRLCIS